MLVFTFMEQEIWKTIPEYEDYQVSNLGNVKSLKFGKEKILKPSNDGRGYLFVAFSLNRKQKMFKIHQLVAMAFLNHNPCGMELVVNHINFNRLDNRLCNLEIISQRENTNKKNLKRSSKYTGVSWCKKNKKWYSSIRINSKTKNLGYFDNEKNASDRYQQELKIITQVKQVCLNE